MDHCRGRGRPRSSGLVDGIEDQCRLTATVDGPTDHFARVEVKHHAAIELALARRVLGDVSQPQLIGTTGGELALDQVLTGPCVLQVLVALFRPRKTLNAQLAHDPLDQLGVHDETLFDLESGFDPQDSVGAPGASVDIGDGVGQEETSNLAVVGLSEFDVVVGRAVEADDLAGVTLGVAQVVQPSDNLELPFGSTPPSSKSSLAALTAFSSASSSTTRLRAARSGSAS